MRKSIYGIFWILSLVMVFLANNSISLAQPSLETTNTQDGQNSVNVEQANDLQLQYNYMTPEKLLQLLEKEKEFRQKIENYKERFEQAVNKQRKSVLSKRL